MRGKTPFARHTCLLVLKNHVELFLWAEGKLEHKTHSFSFEKVVRHRYHSRPCSLDHRPENVPGMLRAVRLQTGSTLKIPPITLRRRPSMHPQKTSPIIAPAAQQRHRIRFSKNKTKQNKSSLDQGPVKMQNIIRVPRATQSPLSKRKPPTTTHQSSKKLLLKRNIHFFCTLPGVIVPFTEQAHKQGEKNRISNTQNNLCPAPPRLPTRSLPSTRCEATWKGPKNGVKWRERT